MELHEFRPVHVRGLYSYSHYEADNGAWIQLADNRETFVFRDPAGNITSYSDFGDMLKEVNKC